MQSGAIDRNTAQDLLGQSVSLSTLSNQAKADTIARSTGRNVKLPTSSGGIGMLSGTSQDTLDLFKPLPTKFTDFTGRKLTAEEETWAKDQLISGLLSYDEASSLIPTLSGDMTNGIGICLIGR